MSAHGALHSQGPGPGGHGRWLLILGLVEMPAHAPTSCAPTAGCTTLILPSTSSGLGVQRCVSRAPRQAPETHPSQPAGARRAGLAECLVGGLPLGGQLPWGLHPTCVTHQETGLFLKRLLLEPLSSRPRLSVQCVCRLPPPHLAAHMASAGPSHLGSGGRSPPQEDPPPPPKPALGSVGQGEVNSRGLMITFPRA